MLNSFFQAFELFPEVLEKLHGLEWDALQEALAIGMLAGNVFDWGAKVNKFLSQSNAILLTILIVLKYQNSFLRFIFYSFLSRKLLC